MGIWMALLDCPVMPPEQCHVNPLFSDSVQAEGQETSCPVLLPSAQQADDCPTCSAAPLQNMNENDGRCDAQAIHFPATPSNGEEGWDLDELKTPCDSVGERGGGWHHENSEDGSWPWWQDPCESELGDGHPILQPVTSGLERSSCRPSWSMPSTRIQCAWCGNSWANSEVRFARPHSARLLNKTDTFGSLRCHAACAGTFHGHRRMRPVSSASFVRR